MTDLEKLRMAIFDFGDARTTNNPRLINAAAKALEYALEGLPDTWTESSDKPIDGEATVDGDTN